MTKTKKILLAVVPVFAVLTIEAGIALWVFQPVRIACDDEAVTAVAVWGRAWLPLESVPSNRVVTIAEIELSALGRQCIGTQRIPDLGDLGQHRTIHG